MYVMPRSKARLSASSALSSSLYMRKRLPPPMARMDTRAPVLPSTRVGSAVGALPSALNAVPTATPTTPVPSRKRRLDQLMRASLLQIAPNNTPDTAAAQQRKAPPLAASPSDKNLRDPPSRSGTRKVGIHAAAQHRRAIRPTRPFQSLSALRARRRVRVGHNEDPRRGRRR